MGYITDQEQKEIISKNLDYLIALSGKDQKQIAIEIDVNPPTFNQWVNGKAIPSVPMLKRVAAYFGVALSQLVNKEDYKHYNNDLTLEEQALIVAYRKADTSLKDGIKRMLNVNHEIDVIKIDESQNEMFYLTHKMNEDA